MASQPSQLSGLLCLTYKFKRENIQGRIQSIFKCYFLFIFLTCTYNCNSISWTFDNLKLLLTFSTFWIFIKNLLILVISSSRQGLCLNQIYFSKFHSGLLSQVDSWQNIFVLFYFIALNSFNYLMNFLHEGCNSNSWIGSKKSLLVCFYDNKNIYIILIDLLFKQVLF